MTHVQKREVLSDWRRSVNTKPGETVDSLTEPNIWRPVVAVLQRLASISGLCQRPVAGLGNLDAEHGSAALHA